MKKFLFIACLLTTTAAFAGTTPPTASSAPAATAAPGQNAPNFADVKAKALNRLAQRLDDVQKRQACVQAANDRDALMACFPKREGFGGHRGGRFGRGGPGGDEGGGPDAQ